MSKAAAEKKVEEVTTIGPKVAEGELVFGGDLDFYNSYAQRGNLPAIENFTTALLALFPRFSRLRLMRSWGGVMDMTMDGSPLMDRVRYDNVFLNAGWCYGGFNSSPASGAAMARFVASGTVPDLIRAFGLSRFATGHLLDEPGYGPYPVRL